MTSYQEGVLSLSYGKDSLACLGAIKKLGLPLTRIIHAEIWATETISADLPPMVEFKKKADEIIKSRWGIEVEHICALKTRGREEANLHTNISFTEKMQKADSREASKDFPAKSENGVKSSNTKTQRLTYEDFFYRMARCNISALPLTSLNVLRDMRIATALCYHLCLRAGTKLIVGSGARKTIFCHPFIQQQRAAAVGFVIIKVSGNFAF